MTKYEKVEHYFATGLWPVKRVKDAVEKGWITKDEYFEIVGQTYENEDGDTSEL